MNIATLRALVTRLAARGGVILFFIIALEVMIMISPFAFFFYSVFNPVFKWLDQYAATHWLTAFFLPHMILPPTLFLKSLRILGSGLFIVGMVTFVVCALQVYLGKIFKVGVATKGLYRFVRHPEYLALGIWGVGMSILWPRFIVLASLSIMFILYSFLARDEEARMRLLYGEAYEQYTRNTGRFFPQSVERDFAFIGRGMPKSLTSRVLIPLEVICVVIGTGFVCRAVTLSSLPFESKGFFPVLRR
jgi:protein-S-isoprenylcysteine O-methyltransferase Ste14